MNLTITVGTGTVQVQYRYSTNWCTIINECKTDYKPVANTVGVERAEQFVQSNRGLNFLYSPTEG